MPDTSRLPAVRTGQQSGNVIERRTEVVAIPPLGFARMERHSHADVEAIGPGLGVQRLLGRQGGSERLRRGRKCRAEGVADRLEYMAIPRDDALPNQFVMTRHRPLHRRPLRLPGARAALDIGEQKGDRAGGRRTVGARFCHGLNRVVRPLAPFCEPLGACATRYC